MQSITNFWKTTIGKLTIIGGGGIAGLLSVCFMCTIFGTLTRSNDVVQKVVIQPTKTPRISSPTEVPSKLQPIETPIQLIPIDTPTILPPTQVPVIEVLPTETPIPEVRKPLVTADQGKVNLRNGPGTNYEIVGTFLPGESLEIVGRNADSSWWQVSVPEGVAWVAANVVTANNVDDSIPVVELPLPPIPIEPLPTENPIMESPPVELGATEQLPVETCDCSGDQYNCKDDFDTHASAQACYEYCKSIGRGDVHGLDRDGDGTACDPTNW